ncbi:hypothetical protein ACIP79_31855 [Streptomyces sp. NPDC088747]|uniref:hypothetical protein n=1 Tax=Streptomyces sp. NPDC088747 TaxID=3365886 RepID=UPI0037FD7144
MTTRPPFDSDRSGISPENAVDAPVPPPPVSAPWPTAPDEAADRPRRARQRYADATDHRYDEPADHGYPEPADNRYPDRADRRYPEPTDHRYSDPAEHRYADPASEFEQRPPRHTEATDKVDEVDQRHSDPVEAVADPLDQPLPDPADDDHHSYINPVDGLVHAAIADRPLDEVIQLIELLEQSPEYAKATVDALRAVGTDRSVEDVSRLVALLTRPPRSADSADEAIRAAAEGRPVADVTRLMALLHQPSLEPHCGEAAVRAAATSRPVEELVELIGRMAEEQDVREARQRDSSTRKGTQRAQGVSGSPSSTDGPSGDRLVDDVDAAAISSRTARARRNRTAIGGDSPAWPRLVAVLMLVVCGLAHFPPHRDGASLVAYGFVIGACGLCVLLGLTLIRRSTLPVLVLGVVVPAALAVAQLLEGRIHSARLSRALDLTLAPPMLAGLAAVLAALAALTALVTFLATRRPGTRSGGRRPKSLRWALPQDVTADSRPVSADSDRDQRGSVTSG